MHTHTQHSLALYLRSGHTIVPLLTTLNEAQKIVFTKPNLFIHCPPKENYKLCHPTLVNSPEEGKELAEIWYKSAQKVQLMGVQIYTFTAIQYGFTQEDGKGQAKKENFPDTAFAIVVSEVQLQVLSEAPEYPKIQKNTHGTSHFVDFLNYTQTIPIQLGGGIDGNGELSVELSCVGTEGVKIATNMTKWWQRKSGQKCRSHPIVSSQEKLYTHLNYREEKLKKIAGVRGQVTTSKVKV